MSPKHYVEILDRLLLSEPTSQPELYAELRLVWLGCSHVAIDVFPYAENLAPAERPDIVNPRIVARLIPMGTD